ncbi:MAG: DMT family transporter [Maritimibacter sp.]
MKNLSPQSRGILLYMLAILSMSVMDLLAKRVSGEVHVIQAVWARYAGQTLLVTLLVLPRIRRVAKTRYPGLQFLRSVFLLGGTTAFFFGISHLGLAEATAIMDINPMLITLGAALFLGEKFGIRRAAGVTAALIGALIVIRPGSDVFSPAALFPFVAAFCYATFVLITRRVGRDEDVWTSLFYTAIFGAVLLSAVVPFVWSTPTVPVMLMMGAIALAGALGQLLMIRALSEAEASAVAPFSYIGLLFAAIWGVLFFAEYPDVYTYVGGAIIVLAGLYVWHRERQSP